MKSTWSWYWLIPIALFIVQLIFTLNSFSQVRQEELSESISYPFWLRERVICNGITSQVGWYGPLLIIYEVFGFDIFTAKYLRLGLTLISYFCLALLLKKYLGEKRAALPLLTAGLSPTLLYFTVLSVPFGLDLQIFPICLYLALTCDFKNRRGIAKQVMLWLLAMLTWMSYPTFIFYIPVLVSVFIYRLYKEGRTQFVTLGLANLAVFLAPVVVAFLYVKNKEMLIYDPVTGGGLFRAHGQINFNLQTFLENLTILKHDLFVASVSYYFELARVEFSNFYPIITIFSVLAACVMFYVKVKRVRKILILLVLGLVLNVTFANLTGETGGIRRATSLLVLFYTLFCFGWYYVLKLPKKLILKKILIGGFFLVFIHHLTSIPANLENLKGVSRFRENQWFSQAETPKESLNLYLDQIQKSDLALVCADKSGKPIFCGGYEYNLIYPAIEGACLWNNLACHGIKIYDFKSEALVPLSLSCWTNNVGL